MNMSAARSISASASASAVKSVGALAKTAAVLGAAAVLLSAAFAQEALTAKTVRRTGGWLFPDDVMARMAPHAASGGAVGPDGLLYVLGHDRPEMYVLAKPLRGPVLTHVTTIAVEAEGQAFSFAPDGARRIAAVDRRKGEILLIDLPEVGTSGLSGTQFFRKR